jgi:hypothetical protein
MKQLALILSATSLLISGALCVGAYVTYKKAEAILNNPEDFVGAVVEKKIKSTLPIFKTNKENKFGFPF